MNYPPASVFFSDSYYTKTYSVISQDIFLAYVYPNDLVIGQILDFDNNASGIVTEIQSDNAKVILMSSDTTNKANLKDIINVPKEHFRLYVPNNSVGSMVVQCSISKSHKAGSIGWTLTDGNNQLIAVGNDLHKKGECLLPGSGSWTEGTYVLRVREFNIPGYGNLGKSMKTWNVAQEVDKLSCGNYDDAEGKLELI